MLYIIAGSRHQADIVAYNHSIDKTAFKFINSVDQLRGISGTEVWLYGQYWLNPCFEAFKTIAPTRNLNIRVIRA